MPPPWPLVLTKRGGFMTKLSSSALAEGYDTITVETYVAFDNNSLVSSIYPDITYTTIDGATYFASDMTTY